MSGAAPEPLEDIAVPVDRWYGGRDTSPVRSPGFGATLERRIPGARRHFDPEGGGATLWTHGPEILRALIVRAG